jgi:Ca2+-binding EF-hand superfamily protein
VRRKIKAAKARTGKSWQDLFLLCDDNKSGVLSPAELKFLIRQVLNVPAATVCEQEFKTLLSEVDRNNDAQLDLAELFEYIQHGPRHEKSEHMRLEQRVERVRRNLVLAFSNFSTRESDVRKLFQKMDLDDSNRCSFYEFEHFVRKELKLTRWDIMNHDLQDFYQYLDRDGDGIDWSELRDYLKVAHGNKANLGGQSFYNNMSANRTRRKRKTYKETLEADVGKPNQELRVGLPFTNLGRDSRPCSRAAASMPLPEKPASAASLGLGLLLEDTKHNRSITSSASAPSLRL